MKTLLSLILCSLLLAGCAQTAPVQTDPAGTAPTELPAETRSYYAPGSVIEAVTQGAVQAFPLEGLDVSGFLPLGENILLFSQQENTSRLTLHREEDLHLLAELPLEFVLTCDNTALQCSDSGICFYDPIQHQTLQLDTQLREVRRIPDPEDLSGLPHLDMAHSILYYCTGDAIRALDLTTNISRMLKAITYPAQSVSGLYLDGSVLSVTLTESGGNRQTLFLSTETGEILRQMAEPPVILTSDSHYYVTMESGTASANLFGAPGSSPQTLLTEELNAKTWFLPNSHRAVQQILSQDEALYLRCYDLETGCCISALTLDPDYTPQMLRDGGSGTLWFLAWDTGYNCQTLYRWNPAKSSLAGGPSFTEPYYTQENPDYEGLAQCTLYAQELSERYGITLHIYRSALEEAPWDYDLALEYRVPIIRRELENLEARLAHFPDGFLETLSEPFTGIHLSIVRRITGSAESGSLTNANGIQFFQTEDGRYDAYIVLASEEDTEHALYHELSHLIDTLILTESTAYDRWDTLNPPGFAYDYDYTANKNRDGSEYLTDSSRAFIDTYAMSFPKEDRARILEYAMTEGNEAYFQSTTMQSKLKLLCEGIRKAFGLRKSPETFLWEQYLNTSLAYTE